MNIVIHPLVQGRSGIPRWCQACEWPLPFPVAWIEGDRETIVAARRELSVTTDEAVLAVLRRGGAAAFSVGTPEVTGPADFFWRVHRWGRASVGVVRSQRDLLPDLRIGSWRGVFGLVRPAAAAFWWGVRRNSSDEEWRALTSVFSVLVYHRLAGEMKQGQVRIDVPPKTFASQLRCLKRAGFRFVSLDELICFYEQGKPLPARRVTAITVDDGAADVVEPLAQANVPTQLFVVTGGNAAASWLDGAPLASWDDFRRLAEGQTTIEAHTRTHPPDLTALDDACLKSEIEGCRLDLTEALGKPARAFAYPHGICDQRVRLRVTAAGYSLAYTTDPGLNRAGTDRFRLRRVSVKAWESRLSLIWKARTGRPLPRAWERWLILRSVAWRSLAAFRSATRDR